MTDRYTKFVLTVIALCLVYSTGKDLIGAAQAQSTVPVNIISVGGIYTAGVLPVHAQ